MVASTTPRWRVAHQGSKDVDYYKSIAVIDDDTIYVVASSSKVMKTTNGGVSWTTLTLPAWESLKQPRAICFPTASTGYVAGDNKIIKTTDYGKTWSTLTFVPPTNITSAYATSENTCYFGGSAKVYCTTDGGLNFSTSATVGAGASYVLVTPNSTVYRAGGSGGIYKSTDGAATFSTSINTKTANVNNTIPCLYFSDNNTGYAVGLHTTSLINSIIKTNDGGTTWSNYSLGSTSTVNTKGPNAVCIPATGTGYVVGTISNAANEIYIRKTTDAGETFAIDTVGAKITDYYSVTITPRGDVYVAGNGCILTRKLVGVTTQVNNSEMGSVTGAGAYYAGELVTLTATANQGYEFDKWTDGTSDISTQPVYSFTATSALHAIQAVFKVSTATSAYPQKSNPVINIHGKEIRFGDNTGGIDVYDVTGKLIVSKNSYEGVIQLHESGIYMIKITSSQDVKAKKIVIR
jgi:photosystem II stability/assembly factor-like uncharacterized protein